MKTEIWKDISGYEGIYLVSNFGHIKSCKRYVNHPKGGKKIINEKILNPSLHGKYLVVALCKNGNIQNKPVHRIVAEEFLGSEKGKFVVNHKNGNKLDNKLENLEWCTQKENVQHAKTFLGFDYRKIAKRNKYVMRNDGKIFCSINDAAKNSNTTRANVQLVLRGKRKTANSFSFKLLDAQVEREWGHETAD